MTRHPSFMRALQRIGKDCDGALVALGPSAFPGSPCTACQAAAKHLYDPQTVPHLPLAACDRPERCACVYSIQLPSDDGVNGKGRHPEG